MEKSQIRYEFGENWRDFSQTITKESIESAVKDLHRLVGDISGKIFFDIGSGSGLHSLAASRLGADKVICVDYDKNCVKTTEKVLTKYAGNSTWSVIQADILQDARISEDKFDIVYSWGVLHHTGDLEKAIRNATSYVVSGGRFVVALYIKTPFCNFWKLEKYIYNKYKWLRPCIKYPYAAVLLLSYLMIGRNVFNLVRNYNDNRGMSFIHDVDDWLGGYPYESITQEELTDYLGSDFKLEKSFNIKRPLGLLGTGCGEWVFVKVK